MQAQGFPSVSVPVAPHPVHVPFNPDAVMLHHSPTRISHPVPASGELHVRYPASQTHPHVEFIVLSCVTFAPPSFAHPVTSTCTSQPFAMLPSQNVQPVRQVVQFDVVPPAIHCVVLLLL